MIGLTIDLLKLVMVGGGGDRFSSTNWLQFEVSIKKVIDFKIEESDLNLAPFYLRSVKANKKSLSS